MTGPTSYPVLSTDCANDWCAGCRYVECNHDCHTAPVPARRLRRPRSPVGSASRERVYDALVAHHLAHGYAPTVRELAAATGLAVGTVDYHLHRLDAAGRVRMRPGRARTVTPAPQIPAPATS